jgi:hypothetical protein
MINALIWYCQNAGVDNPVISLMDGAIVKWDCGEVGQPTPAQMQTILTQYQASQDYAEVNFNYKTFIGRVYEVFAADLLRLEARLPLVEALIKYPNFPGLKGYLQACVAAELITQADYDALAGILLEQGVDLTKIT